MTSLIASQESGEEKGAEGASFTGGQTASPALRPRLVERHSHNEDKPNNKVATSPAKSKPKVVDHHVNDDDDDEIEQTQTRNDYISNYQDSSPEHYSPPDDVTTTQKSVSFYRFSPMMKRVSSIHPQTNKEEAARATTHHHLDNEIELYEQAMGTQTQSSALGDSEVSFIMRKVEKLKQT